MLNQSLHRGHLKNRVTKWDDRLVIERCIPTDYIATKRCPVSYSARATLTNFTQISNKRVEMYTQNLAVNK